MKTRGNTVKTMTGGAHRESTRAAGGGGRGSINTIAPRDTRMNINLEPRARHGVLSTAGRERLKGSRAQLEGLREFTEAGRELLMQRDGTFRRSPRLPEFLELSYYLGR